MAKKSTQKSILSGCVVCSEHHIDKLYAKSIGKEHLKVFITEQFIKKTVFLGGIEWNIQKEPLKVFYKKAVLKNSAIFRGKDLCWSPCNFIKKGLQRWCLSVNIVDILKATFFTKHLQATASGSWIWKYFPVLTKLFFARRIMKQKLWRRTFKPCSTNCYQLAGKGTLMCKTFYLVNFMLFVLLVLFIMWTLWLSFIQMVLRDILLMVICKWDQNLKILATTLGNPDLDATVTDFMAVLQSIDYSKFKIFSNVADEISTKLLWSFPECEVLVVVPDWYDFEFSIKPIERKCQR